MSEKNARSKRSAAAAAQAEKQRAAAEVGQKAVERAGYREANTRSARLKRAAQK